MAGLLTRAKQHVERILGRSDATLLEAASPRRGWPIDRAATVPGVGVPFGLDLVRRRSRHATHSNPHMARAAEGWTTALIGDGITLTSLHPSPAVRTDFQTRFAAWGARCDAEGRADWPGLQAAIAREMVVSGEAFVHVVFGPGGMRLRLIPGDLVSDLHRELGGGGFIHAGIEFGADGSRTAYHIHTRRPDGFATVGNPIRVPAADILHVFRAVSGPGQIRGVPWAAPVLLTLSELDGLLDGLLTGARVASLHAGFLLDTAGIGGAGVPYDGVQVGSVLESGLEPGTLKVLPAGWDIKFSQPAQAAQGIELAKLSLRSIAAGLGLPEAILTGDYSQANYSSLRAAFITWRQLISQIQYGVLVPQLLRPVYERWVEYSLLTGELDLTDAETISGEYLSAEFYPPAMPGVDVEKDANAEAALIAAGLKSRRQAVAAQGYDVETLDAEIAADRAREAALGLSFTQPAREKPDA